MPTYIILYDGTRPCTRLSLRSMDCRTRSAHCGSVGTLRAGQSFRPAASQLRLGLHDRARADEVHLWELLQVCFVTRPAWLQFALVDLVAVAEDTAHNLHPMYDLAHGHLPWASAKARLVPTARAHGQIRRSHNPSLIPKDVSQPAETVMCLSGLEHRRPYQGWEAHYVMKRCVERESLL